jgi:hypothetical protein
MRSRPVIWLAIVALVALLAAGWLLKSRQPVQEGAVAAPLVPGLEQGINEIRALRIRTAGDELRATLVRGDSGWTVEQRDGWPVDVGKLRDFLLKLAQAKRIEPKTDNPSLYYKLGVEDITTKDTPGVQLEIDGLAQPLKLIIGRNVVRGTGTYARIAGEAPSWQTDADLAVDTEPASWLQRDLVDIAAGRVSRVEVTPVQGPEVEIAKAPSGGGGDFVVANLPKGREAASAFVADATAGFLAALRFDDVLSADAAAAPADGVTRARFETEEGIGVDVAVWTAGERQVATLAAQLDETRAQAYVAEAQERAAREHDAMRTAGEASKDDAEAADATPEAAAPLASTDPAADRALRLETLRAEVEGLNARVADRAFVLPAFKTANVTRSLEDYLKPEE